MTSTSSPRHGTRTRGAIFAPLEEVGRAVRVEQRLADAIRSGVLRDGERLPSESELAAMLGVATVTAREALVSLRAQGLISTVRGRNGGSYVTRANLHDPDAQAARLAAMSRVELHDRGTLHLVILAGCAELAAEYADAADVDLLVSLLPEAGDEDPGHWRHADAELHLTLAALEPVRTDDASGRRAGGRLRCPAAPAAGRAGVPGVHPRLPRGALRARCAPTTGTPPARPYAASWTVRSTSSPSSTRRTDEVR